MYGLHDLDKKVTRPYFCHILFLTGELQVSPIQREISWSGRDMTIGPMSKTLLISPNIFVPAPVAIFVFFHIEAEAFLSP